jgi:hypothetical protein
MEAGRVNPAQRLTVRGGNAQAAGLGPDGVSRPAEAVAYVLGMDACRAPVDEADDISDQPTFGTGPTKRSVVRSAQAQADQAVVEGLARQAEEKADRLDTLACRDHAGHHAVEGEDSRRGHHEQQVGPRNGCLLCLG